MKTLVKTNERDGKISKSTGYNNEEIAVLKKTVAKGVTDTELYFFLTVAKGLNLNPFNKEIWCYKDHKGNLLTFAGRDGFLTIAQRDSKWNGIYSCEVREGDEYSQEFDGEKVNLKHKKTTKKGKILGAYCFIRPKDCDIPTIEYVDFDTYNKGSYVWKSHSADMIKKVAEIHALKKAFGISGIHSDSDFTFNDDKAYPVDTEDILSSTKQSFVYSLINSSGLEEDEKTQLENELIDMTITRADELIVYLKENQPNPIESGNNYSLKHINEMLDKKEKDDK